jgi:putative transposase
LDKQDYTMFLTILERYLSPRIKKSNTFEDRFILIKNPKYIGQNLSLFAFCLMPNHFHLLIKQKNAKFISVFMKKVVVSYALYFNKKYKRSGALFQNRYQGSLLQSKYNLKRIYYYIHSNPKEAGIIKNYDVYKWSSLYYYKKMKWLRSDLHQRYDLEVQ